MCFSSSQISTVLSKTWKKHLLSNTGFGFCYWNSTLWLSHSLGQLSEQHRYCLGVPRPGVTTAPSSVGEVTLRKSREAKIYLFSLYIQAQHTFWELVILSWLVIFFFLRVFSHCEVWRADHHVSMPAHSGLQESVLWLLLGSEILHSVQEHLI